MRPSDADANIRIECFCARKPLLAVAGRDSRSHKGFVWVKSVKNGRLQVEVVITDGRVELTCRECFRVHAITVHPDTSKIFEFLEVSKEILVQTKR